MTDRWASLAVALAAVFVAETRVAAQPSARPINTRPGLGAMVHAALISDQNVVEDKQTVDFAVNADWPLSSDWRVRGEFGRAGWNFDGQAGLPAPLPTERITITRITASMIRSLDWLDGAYAGGGGGLYRYAAEVSPLPRHTRPGLHFITGLELGSARGGLAFRLEGQFQAVGGPGAAYSRDASPVTGAPTDGSYSRVSSNVLLNLVFGIGVGWRF